MLPVPLPASSRPGRIPVGWQVAIGLVMCAPLVVAAGLFIPTGNHALSPGPAEDVGKLIRVEDASEPSRGAFLLTTVSVTLNRINLFESLQAALDPTIEVVPRSALVGEGLTDEEQDEFNQADMEDSKYVAAVVALRAAGLAVTPVPGARVIKVFSGSPAATALKENDVIVGVGGKTVRSVAEMTTAIRARPVGTALRIDVLRGEREMSFTLRTAADPVEGRPIIGIRVEPAFHLPVDVAIDSQNIVGPSAGMMFALAIADAIREEDLTGGYRIAGTGTIDLNGGVGPIGGAGQKVLAAERAGAEIFLAPEENAAEAQEAARHMRVYAVKDLREAVDLLAGLPPKRGN